jgi:hypothetical protein
VKIVARLFFFVAFVGVWQSQTEGAAQEELPDDYLPITLFRIDDRLEGGSEFLEGFTFTLNAPSDFLWDELNTDTLIALVMDHNVSGTLTYPSGRTTPIEYEIVRHRGIEEIYMKSSLGYFLWEYLVASDNTLSLAIYWWYCPPATEKDLEIIEMAKEILADPNRWSNDDDRECKTDIETNQWSLFCALKHSSIEILNEYNHHGTAIQSARFAIDELVPNHGFPHTLMDYNNGSSTNHRDIMHVLDLARLRIEGELRTQQSGSCPGDE